MDTKQNEWESHKYDDHVRPLNELVDDERKRDGKRIPYFDPDGAGENARLLCLLQDPGKEALNSDRVSMSNEDPTARMLAKCFGAVRDQTVLWNAYPWPLRGLKLSEEKKPATIFLEKVLERLPKLEVVALMGNRAWELWPKVQPWLLNRGRWIPVVHMPHPSARATQAAGKKQAAYDTFAGTARCLREYLSR